MLLQPFLKFIALVCEDFMVFLGVFELGFSDDRGKSKILFVGILGS